MSKRVIRAEEYQDCWEDDPKKWSIVPSTYAAKILGKSLPAIEELVARDKLDSVVIKGAEKSWKGVTMTSLQLYQEQIDKERIPVDDVFEQLEIIAKGSEKKPVYYSEFMDKFGLNYKNPHHRGIISALLGKVSEKTLSNKSIKFMLSVLVVNKSTDMPSEGFYTLAKNLKEMSITESREDFFKRQLELVFTYYKS